MNKRTAKRLKAMPAIIMAAAVFTGIMAAGSTSADAKPSVKLDGEYHAALGVRTGSGKNIYRMAYYHKKSAGTDKWKHLATGDYSSEEYQEIQSTFKDVVIKGNGKYTVSLTNADFQGETSFSRMQVSTDIPDTGKIKFSDMSVKINGSELVKYDEPYIDKHRDADGNCCLLVINGDREGFDSLDGNCVPQGTENTISITFKVSGFSYNKGEKPKPTETPAPTPTKTPAPEEPEDTPEPKETSKVTPAPDTSSQKPVVSEEIRPAVIISIIVAAVISVIAITFSVTKRKK